MHVDQELHRCAAAQHGLISTTQARDAGLTTEAIRHRTESGVWQRVRPTVLRIAGSPETDESRLVLATLDAGPAAFVSHHAAAAQWGIPGFDLRTIHVTRLRGSTSRPSRDLVLHEPRILPDHHRTSLHGVPLLTPARTIFDLAGVVSSARTERALDTAWSKRLVTAPGLHRMLEELAERGRTGISVMRQLLDDRGVDYRPMDSGTEVRARQILREDGIGGFEHQVDLGDEQEWIGRVDLVDQQRGIVIEIDSARYHGALIDQRADARRTKRLEDAGYVVRRVDDTTVWHHPDEFVRIVREARRAAAARPR